MSDEKKPAPVADVQEYWTKPPPSPSPRCTWWVSRIKAGWRPNRRISSMGYHSSAEFYGVYIWEYINVIYPLTAAGDRA